MNYLIPQFTMGDTAKIDWSPAQNVLSQWREQQNKDRALAEQQRQFNSQNALAQRASARADELQPWQIKQIQSGIDNQAGQLDIARRASARADEMQPLHIAQTRAQIDHLRQQGATEAQLLPYKIAYQKALTDYTQSRAGLADAKAASQNYGMREDGSIYDLDAEPQQKRHDNSILPPDRPAIWGGHANLPVPQAATVPRGVQGALPQAPIPQAPGPMPVPQLRAAVEQPPGIPPGIPVAPAPNAPAPFPPPMRLGGPKPQDDPNQGGGTAATPPDPFARPATPYGPVGVSASQIPGVVLTDKGNSDALATRYAEGQRALGSVPQSDRDRLLNAQRIQQTFTALYGKPKVGYAYNAQGRQIPLDEKESVQDRQSIAIATEGLKALDYAERTLKSSGTTAQLFGDTYHLWGDPHKGTEVKIGGYGKTGRGFRSAKAAVMDLNFAISGKSVSNAERQAFLDVYMPTATDSRETQAWKLGRVRSFFNTALQARKSGATDEQIADLYRSEILNGQRQAAMPQQALPQAAPPSAPPANPVNDRLKSKYGLE